MHKYTDNNKLYDGEKLEILHGSICVYKYDEFMPWFTKGKVLLTIKEKWRFESCYITVNKVLWNSEFAWFRNDNVKCEKIAFDMFNLKDLDELVGYLFQASIDGYTIRYISPDNFTGMYLERTKDNSTNIDEDVISTLMEVVKCAVEDRKPRR